jgi:hypothetical protein
MVIGDERFKIRQRTEARGWTEAMDPETSQILVARQKSTNHTPRTKKNKHHGDIPSPITAPILNTRNI